MMSFSRLGTRTSHSRRAAFLTQDKDSGVQLRSLKPPGHLAAYWLVHQHDRAMQLLIKYLLPINCEESSEHTTTAASVERLLLAVLEVPDEGCLPRS